MDMFKQVLAKNITTGNLDSDKIITKNNTKVTFTKDGMRVEANSVKFAGEVSSQECIVFTNSGQTYHFKNVTDFAPTTTGFSFTYMGVATGVTRKAVFDYTSVVGYALN